MRTDNWKEDQEDAQDHGIEDKLDGASQKVKEYAQLKKEMLRSRRAIKVLTGQQAEDVKRT